MNLRKYNDFINKETVNENVQNAKKFMRDTYLASKTEGETPVEPKEGEAPVQAKLTPDEIRKAENDPDFLKIKKLVERNPGYTEVFTRFFFRDKVSMDDLTALYNTLLENRDSLNKLPKQVDKYLESEKRYGLEDRTAYEDLVDDIERIKNYRKVKKIIDELPSELKHDVLRITGKLKERFDGAAIGLFDLDPILRKEFFKKISAIKTADEATKRMEQYVKACTNDGLTELLKKVEDVNAKYGEKWGATIAFMNEEKERVIVELKSFDACRLLCAQTNWCIARTQGHWDQYVGNENKFTKQYAIFDYALPPTDLKSIIGCTVNMKGTFDTAHTKNDSYIDEGQVRKRLDEEENAAVRAMTNEEKDQKEKYNRASRELKAEKLPSLDRIKECLAEGANINIEAGKPLRNAVKSNNLEVAEFLLDNGANPDIPYEKNKTAVSLVKTFDMLKLLLKHGANMNKEAFKSLSGDFDAVKYIVEEYGVDPNFEDSYAIRAACRTGNLPLIKYLVEKGVDINSKEGMPLKFAAENGFLDLVQWLIENGADRGYVQAIKWAEIALEDSTGEEAIRSQKIIKLLKDNISKNKQ
jgi:ankyrin repeat protein